MNHQLLCALAEQRSAELRSAELMRAGSARRRTGHGRRPRRSLRERTGWALVGLGLRLAGPPVRDGRPVMQSAR